jgi:hypothetical protein
LGALIVTNAVVDLFKDQLNTELRHLSETRPYKNLISDKPDPGVAFPHWYFERIEQFERAEADEIITDGFDDEKIDAIHITEDGTTVRFFQFKNPSSKNAGIDDAAVDGILTTVDIFLSSKKRKKKTALDAIFEEIRSAIRAQYKIIFVTSGRGLAPKQVNRIEEKLKQWNGPNRNAFSYEALTLESLLDRVYQESIPTIKSTIEWKLDTPPYQTKINDHKSLVCHIDGKSLASAYEIHGEKLLQQNIRNTEGVTPSNRDIYITATTSESDNFYFYNNGITVLCDAWDYDQPSWRLSVTRPQIVNGGQTIRQIALAAGEAKLRDNVRVLLRVISIGDNKEFAGNVAVNLNNQTVVRSSFLKSNHPFFIQMQHALLPMGWYFERKQGDWENLSASERADLLGKIESETKIIQMQTGCQAYSAVYLQDIDLAKKNPKFIFLPKRSGGRFEDVATSHFTPTRLIQAYSILTAVENVHRQIRALRHFAPALRQSHLRKILRTRATVSFDDLVPMVSQAGLFISGLVAHQLEKTDVFEPTEVEKIIRKSIVRTFTAGTDRAGSWASLLKSQLFFEEVKKTLRSNRAVPALGARKAK